MANLIDTSVNGDLRVTGTMFGTQAGNYATCSTAGATAAKTATISGFTLTTGMHVYVKFSENNSAAVGSLTLNISGTGAKPIKCRGGNNLGTSGSIAANGIYEFAYDGTNWEMVGSAVTGVKGANESSYRWGNVNITAENVGAAASSHAHGNIQNGGTLQTNDITIASGDKLVVTDSSDSSKVARASISFDGSTTTKALTQKGTWESFAKSDDITTAIQALDVSSVGGDGKYISAISETDGKISAAATTMDTTPTANSTKAVTSGGIKTALNDKFDKYGFFDKTDGKWIGAALSVGGETEVKYWKLCSFTTHNWWTLNFVADVTNAYFDFNVFERKIIAISGSTPGVVASALEIREGNNQLYSTRGYGNIIYYETSGNNVTIYIKAKFAANVGQFCRLVSVLSVNSILNLTWYQETTAGTQPENPVKFSLGYKTVKPAGSTSVPVYIGSDGNPTACTDDFVHDGDVTSTYSSTGTAPVNGTAVASALGSYLPPSGSISAGDDLNSYNTANRNYICKATDSSSVSNRPSGASGAFELEVIRGTGDTCVQIYYSRDDVSFNYIRKHTGNSNNKWTAWVKLIDSTDGVTQTYFALANESAFDDVKAAYTAGKRIVGALGGTTSSDNLFRQETPLAFVVFTDNEPTAFTFLFENASPRTASGEGRGSTARWTVSSSGWAISTDNVDYAVTAGTANTAGTLSATLQIAKGGTGATSATAAEYNLLTKTTTKLSAVPAGTDRILFAVGSPSASNGRIGGYRTVDNVADYTLSKVDHYRQNEGISYYQRLCYAKTTGNPGSKGNVHLYDGTNWHNLCNLSSSAGTVRIAGLTSSPATATSNYTKMDIVTGLTLARNGYMGMLYGYVAPKYTTGAQLPTASSDTATSYTTSGKTMAHCSQLKIDGFDTEAVGSGHAVFTGSSILHIALLSGTLTFAIEGDFSVFTSGAQYFFSIPVSFGNLKA